METGMDSWGDAVGKFTEINARHAFVFPESDEAEKSDKFSLSPLSN